MIKFTSYWPRATRGLKTESATCSVDKTIRSFFRYGNRTNMFTWCSLPKDWNLHQVAPWCFLQYKYSYQLIYVLIYQDLSFYILTGLGEVQLAGNQQKLCLNRQCWQHTKSFGLMMNRWRKSANMLGQRNTRHVFSLMLHNKQKISCTIFELLRSHRRNRT